MNEISESDDMSVPQDLFGLLLEYQGPGIVPLYIVCDESSSMAGASIDAVNDGIVELFDEINCNPIIDQKFRIGIIAFDDTARLLFPLTQLSDVTKIPKCAASGGLASYSSAFRLLRTQLEADVAQLRQRYRVHRPIVLFVSLGEPNPENWQAALDNLVDPSFPFSPNIVSFGVAGAQQAVIAQVARWNSGSGKKFFFMADEGGSPGAAIKEIIRFFMQLGSIQIEDRKMIGGAGPDDGQVTMFVIGP